MALVAGALALVVATAGVMYVVMRPNAGQTAAAPEAAGASASDQAAAKKEVCDTLEIITRGQPGKGAVRLPDGQVNAAVVQRIVTGVVALQDVLGPAVPADVQKAAREYIHAAMKLTTAASSEVDVDQINSLNAKSNSAVDEFLSVCGIPK